MPPSSTAAGRPWRPWRKERSQGLVRRPQRPSDERADGRADGYLVPREKNPLGQYWTPRDVADLMVGMLRTPPEMAAVLEPSSGAGVFLDALTEAGYSDVVGIEVDPILASHGSAAVHCGSFVVWDPERRVDAVVGNPPYIRWRDLSDTARDEMKASPLWGQLFNSLTDYLTVFIAKSVEHLRPGGELIFITPSFWMHTAHSEPLRDWLLERGFITDIVDFGEAQVFPGVSSSIVIFRYVKNGGSTRKNGIRLHRYIGPRRVTGALSLSDKATFRKVAVPRFKKGEHWTLAAKSTQDSLDALERACTSPDSTSYDRLGDVVDIANGMVSGLDAAFRVPPETVRALSTREESAVMQVIKAKNMERVISTRLETYSFIPRGLSEDQATKRYPNLLAALAPYRVDLDKRYTHGDCIPHWEWSFPRSESFHRSSRKKIFVPCKERLTCRPHPRFTLAPAHAIATQDVTALAPKDGVKESPEYLVAFLSLPEVGEWIRCRGLMKGGVAEFSEAPLSRIPVRRVDFTSPTERLLHDKIRDEVRNWESAGKTPSDEELDALLALVRGLVYPG